MFAPQNQTPSTIDAISGSLTEWYNQVDDAIKVSEIIPGNYEYTTATSYGNVGDINEGDTTFVDIFCDRFKIISIDNSFITLKQIIKIHVPDQSNLKFTEYYVGYKCSADCIDHYRIYSNTDKIIDQHHARYEWFMFYNSLSDEVKRCSDCFATLDKIRHHSTAVPGVYIDVSSIKKTTTTTGTGDNASSITYGENGADITVEIPLRIPISFFLPLFDLRYYPNWAGKLSIELMPTYQNLVIAPVISDSDFKDIYSVVSADSTTDLGFRNINETVKNNIKTDGSVMAAGQKFECITQTTKNVKIKLATYLLQMDVFNSLAARYIQVPMLFPIHVVQVRDFTQPLGTKSTYNTAATIGLKHCDTLFCVFRQSQYSRTCFVNPQIKYSFNVDGKFYPREPYKTVDDAKHVNMTFDALNVNNSLLTSVSKDISTSMQPYYYVHKYTLDKSDKITCSDIKKYHGLDNSNFFIGIPFADSTDFMGGISTTGTVQIELMGDRVEEEDNITNFIAPTGIYFEDALMKIRAMKPDGRSQIEITNATIEQIIAGAAK